MCLSNCKSEMILTLDAHLHPHRPAHLVRGDLCANVHPARHLGDLEEPVGVVSADGAGSNGHCFLSLGSFDSSFVTGRVELFHVKEIDTRVV